MTIHIRHHDIALDYSQGIEHLAKSLDCRMGMYMSSNTDYPGRYSRYDLAFDLPILEIIAYVDHVLLRAHGEQGQALFTFLCDLLPARLDGIYRLVLEKDMKIFFPLTAEVVSEDLRSQSPGPCQILSKIKDCFVASEGFAGFYGAFAYDLLFSFEPITLIHERSQEHRLFHLFVPAQLYICDRRKEFALCRVFEFVYADQSVILPYAPAVVTSSVPSKFQSRIQSCVSDVDYELMVRQAQKHIAMGDVFELVLSRDFYAETSATPSQIFDRLKELNPSPYQFLLQMGEDQLIGASPEMFVRVEGKMIETCPISGTIARSKLTGQEGVLEDAVRLRSLLNSAKDEVELNMCTDVDRNDKARVCKPGSVQIIGRRQIESYRGLYHTVDHVIGELRDDCDAMDGFLSHMWAVTLTGAPKRKASELIEKLEPSPRLFYGAAVGAWHFNGNMNTGITIRTVHLHKEIATYQAGASIVADSDPWAEVQETYTKSRSFHLLMGQEQSEVTAYIPQHGKDLKILILDYEDSFVHNLADYMRQCGAVVQVVRHGWSLNKILETKPDLVVHSPGPGHPSEFGMEQLIQGLAQNAIPQFGVCLGLQAMILAFGGKLDYLPNPHHGKVWQVSHQGQSFFENLANPCIFAAYHSIYASQVPECLQVLAYNEQDVPMAIAHKTLPLWAVQFHPESLLSMGHGSGLKLLDQVLQEVRSYVL